MMKAFFFLIMAALMSSVMGCQLGGPSLTLPNGYVPTAQEMEKLNAVTPEAEGARQMVAGSRNWSDLSAEERQALINSYVEKLKGAFGHNYKKFFLKEEVSIMVDAQTGNVVYSTPRHYVDPESDVSTTPRTGDVYTGSYPYIIYGSSGHYWLPWVTWNYALTRFRYYTGSVGSMYFSPINAASIMARVEDERGIVGRTLWNAAEIEVWGNGIGGLFPAIFPCAGYHQVIDPHVPAQYQGVYTTNW